MHSPQKVLAAEGGKGVPLDGELSELLQGLLKLDPRHRISAREALASPYFARRVGAAEERVRAPSKIWKHWSNHFWRVSHDLSTCPSRLGPIRSI